MHHRGNTCFSVLHTSYLFISLQWIQPPQQPSPNKPQRGTNHNTPNTYGQCTSQQYNFNNHETQLR